MTRGKATATPSRDEGLLARMAAFLAAEGNHQSEIGRVIGVSQSTVSRLLARARDEGWLTTECHLNRKQRAEVQHHLYTRYDELLDAVEKCSGPDAVPLVHVFYAGEATAGGYASPKQLDLFGRLAAQRFRDLLPGLRFVGVAWGKTVAAIAAALRMVPGELGSGRTVQFFPVCGEPVDYPVNRYSASTLSAAFHDIVNEPSDQADVYSLGSTPARIPGQFTARQGAVIRDFIRKSRGYQAIFEAEDALIKKMDAVLTSAGTVDKQRDDVWLQDLSRTEELSLQKLAELTIGDIGGVFVERPALPTRSRREIQQMNERWTGVSMEQLHDCADRARRSKDAGVVLFAAGHKKVEIVRAALERRVVNDLVIDQTLAESFIRLCREKPAG